MAEQTNTEAPRARTAADIEFPVATRYKAMVEREDGSGWDPIDVEVRELTTSRFVRIINILSKALRSSESGDILGFISEHPEEINQALAIALSQDVSVVERLPWSQSVQLALAVYEANRESFARRLSSRSLASITTMLAAGAQEATPTNGAGRTSEPTSADTATASPAS